MMLIIENDQAIFRGNSSKWPTEVWDCGAQSWKPYKGDVPKEAGWGNVITPEEATGYMEPN